ncbi:MAG: hypothetical protein MJE77_17920 [Proteobacteria bacterium]|nr:hypothetical protein [Pseudomonadota bacterium]
MIAGSSNLDGKAQQLCVLTRSGEICGASTVPIDLIGHLTGFLLSMPRADRERLIADTRPSLICTRESILLKIDDEAIHIPGHILPFMRSNIDPDQVWQLRLLRRDALPVLVFFAGIRRSRADLRLTPPARQRSRGGGV